MRFFSFYIFFLHLFIIEACKKSRNSIICHSLPYSPLCMAKVRPIISDTIVTFISQFLFRKKIAHFKIKKSNHITIGGKRKNKMSTRRDLNYFVVYLSNLHNLFILVTTMLRCGQCISYICYSVFKKEKENTHRLV